ncbi:MAG TPA: hypothetical protein VIG25_18480 [Pyrinomonadaceae bacterium]
MQTNSSTHRQRFALGQTYITPAAEEALMIAGQSALEFLRCHMCGDFGELSEDDLRENDLSLKEGFRLLSTYGTAKGQKLWIITEADRSSTTILIPAEYYSAPSQHGASASHSRRSVDTLINYGLAKLRAWSLPLVTPRGEILACSGLRAV